MIEKKTEYSFSDSELELYLLNGRSILTVAAAHSIFDLAVLSTRIVYNNRWETKEEAEGPVAEELRAKELSAFKILTLKGDCTEFQLIAYCSAMAIDPMLLLAAIEYLLEYKTLNLKNKSDFPVIIAKLCILSVFVSGPIFTGPRKRIRGIIDQLMFDYQEPELTKYERFYQKYVNSKAESNLLKRRQEAYALLDLPVKILLPDQLISCSYLDDNLHNISTSIIKLLCTENASLVEVALNVIVSVRKDLSASLGNLLANLIFEIIKENYYKQTLNEKAYAILLYSAFRRVEVRVHLVKQVSSFIKSIDVLQNREHCWYMLLFEELIGSLHIPDSPWTPNQIPLIIDDVTSAICHFWRLSVNTASDYAWMYFIFESLKVNLSCLHYDIDLIEKLLNEADSIKGNGKHETNFKEILTQIHKDMKAGLLPERRRRHFGLPEVTEKPTWIPFRYL